MSRRRSRPDAPRAATPRSSDRRPRPKRPASRSRTLLVRWIAALLLLVAVVVLAWHPWRHAAPPDPFAGMDVNAAADTADALDKRGKYVEALPYVAYLERVGEVTAAFESRAATAANNASIQVRAHHGLVIPVTRSSIERVELVRESMRRAQRAEDMTPGPQWKAAFKSARAGQLAVWGFQREAFAEYRLAATFAPLSQRALSEARWMSRMLTDPTTTVPAQPALLSAPVGEDSAAVHP